MRSRRGKLDPIHGVVAHQRAPPAERRGDPGPIGSRRLDRLPAPVLPCGGGMLSRGGRRRGSDHYDKSERHQRENREASERAGQACHDGTSGVDLSERQMPAKEIPNHQSARTTRRYRSSGASGGRARSRAQAPSALPGARGAGRPCRRAAAPRGRCVRPRSPPRRPAASSAPSLAKARTTRPDA